MADAIKPFAGISAPLITGLFAAWKPPFRPTAEGRFTDFRFARHWGSFSPAAGGPFSTQYHYEETMLLKDKKCLIFGVANNRSIAYGIASALRNKAPGCVQLCR